MTPEQPSSLPFVLDPRTQAPLTVYRGERSGEHDAFRRDWDQSRSGFFFAEDLPLAQGYDLAKIGVRAFHLHAGRVLDLTTDPWNLSNTNLRRFLQAFRSEFDEWIDRSSGEPCDLETYLETGTLYHYEPGTAHRWNALFEFAESQGYDAVVALDSTDGVDLARVWVVFHPDQIHWVDTVSSPDHGGTSSFSKDYVDVASDQAPWGENLVKSSPDSGASSASMTRPGCE